MEDLAHVNLKVPLSLTAEYGFSSVEIGEITTCIQLCSTLPRTVTTSCQCDVMHQVLPSYLRAIRSPLYNMRVEQSASVTPLSTECE